MLVEIANCLNVSATVRRIPTHSMTRSLTKMTASTCWQITASPACLSRLSTTTRQLNRTNFPSKLVSGDEQLHRTNLAFKSLHFRRAVREAGGRGRAGLVQGKEGGPGGSLPGQLRGECLGGPARLGVTSETRTEDRAVSVELPYFNINWLFEIIKQSGSPGNK